MAQELGTLAAVIMFCVGNERRLEVFLVDFDRWLFGLLGIQLVEAKSNLKGQTAMDSELEIKV